MNGTSGMRSPGERYKDPRSCAHVNMQVIGLEFNPVRIGFKARFSFQHGSWKYTGSRAPAANGGNAVRYHAWLSRAQTFCAQVQNCL